MMGEKSKVNFAFSGIAEASLVPTAPRPRTERPGVTRLMAQKTWRVFTRMPGELSVTITLDQPPFLVKLNLVLSPLLIIAIYWMTSTVVLRP